VDRPHRNDALEKVRKRYADRDGRDSYEGVTAHNDFRDVLANPAVDAVFIVTPDHWHADIACAAARAGKDLYCEKPVSHTVRQGRAMADAVLRYGRVFQTGSWQRSQRDFRFACELVRNGRIGRLKSVLCGLPGSGAIGPQPVQPVPDGFDYEMWLGPAPRAPYTAKRCHFDWRWQYAYGGGQLADWGPHHLDIAQWALGTDRSGPVAVEGTATFPEAGLWDAPTDFRVEFEYASGLKVTATDGAENGIRFEGDAGWVFVSRERIDAHPASLLKERIGPTEIRLPRTKGHTDDFYDCVRTRRETIAPIEVAHRTATMSHLGNIAIRLGRRVRWDPATETIIGDPQASAMLDHPLRAPWHL
jgi:predicted dehydrogenase